TSSLSVIWHVTRVVPIGKVEFSAGLHVIGPGVLSSSKLVRWLYEIVAPAGLVALTVTSFVAMRPKSPSHVGLSTPPSSATDSEPDAAVSAKTRLPVTVPHTVGVKVTCTLQNAATASGLGAMGQSVAETAKSPVVVIELIRVGPVPAAKMRSCAGLVVVPMPEDRKKIMFAWNDRLGFPAGVTIPDPNSHVSL